MLPCRLRASRGGVTMRWLVALDESEFSERIIGWMRAFPHSKQTAVTVVHVLAPLDVPETIGLTGQQLLLQQQGAMVEALLQRVRRLLEESFADVEVILREGVPSREILQVIQERRPDLVVSGMQGLYRSPGFTIGGVAQRLLSYAPCSLMLVPGKAQPGDGLRIMLATDGSEDARRAARVVAELPGVRETMIVSVVRPLGAEKAVLERFQPEESRKMEAAFLRRRRAEARKALAECECLLRQAVMVVRARVIAGHPAEAIVRAARRDAVDLLVVGSRGLTGMKATALGSVSQTVAQLAPCPVLIVKP
ncbi:MAG: hypothetical protein NBKEAIPA_03249 [Nitrospirae bacterium]|nr:hypothetical protein [Nitrospirota bacterium]MCE7966584.1 universal stress protein [Nitrospira sp. NTP2]